MKLIGIEEQARIVIRDDSGRLHVFDLRHLLIHSLLDGKDRYTVHRPMRTNPAHPHEDSLAVFRKRERSRFQR